MDWNTFFSSEVTMSQGFKTCMMISKIIFTILIYYISACWSINKMCANQSNIMLEDPNNGLDIDPLPPPDYPDFSNHFTTNKICWLVDNWFYIYVCVCCLSEKNIIFYRLLKIKMICCVGFEIWRWVLDLFLLFIGQKMGGKSMLWWVMKMQKRTSNTSIS